MPAKLQITEKDVLSILTMPKAIELLETAFCQLADGTSINHPRQRVVLPTGSILHYMAAGTPEFFGIKVYSTNPKSGAHFEVLLFRSSDGIPLANIEANHLGQIRTGAASGVATRHLAREDASVAAVIGSGFQAETQLAAIASVRKLSDVRVWSRKAERREAFAKRCSERFGISVRAVASAPECVASADIVVTVTSAIEPVLRSEWIAAGTHINAAGSNWAHRRELDSDLILRRNALVAVDSIDVGRIESGDLMIPMQETGRPDLPAVELADIVAGRRPGRQSRDQITIFKSNGLAVEDIAVAGYVYGRISGPVSGS